MTGVTWRLYGSSGVWHAFRTNTGVSVCGCVGAADDQPHGPEPRGRACRTCQDKTGEAAPFPARKREAQQYLRDVGRRVESHTCRCVREWEGAPDLVAEAEHRLAALLLAWEMTGYSVDARDIEDAARALHTAWKEARQRYDLLDGSHPHRTRRHR